MRYRHGISGSQYAGECGDRSFSEEDAEEIMREVCAKGDAQPVDDAPLSVGDITHVDEDADGNGTFEWTEIVDDTPGEDWAEADEGDDNGNGRWLLIDSEGRRYIAVTYYLAPEEE